ncbi:MAG: hypothetical protein M1836_006872 [Candelina mexicana]|nr:MAG: hypothetical protein M1836_006872 [Candelina mexicana]
MTLIKEVRTRQSSCDGQMKADPLFLLHQRRPVQTLQQALVELEKGPEAFPEQLAKAYKIIGIPLETTSTLLQDHFRHPQVGRKNAFSAKEEWVLRWLLNRLQAVDQVGKNARSDTRSWLLLIRLLQQIPLANAARQLNAHKFMIVLEQVSNEVKELAGLLHDDPPPGELSCHSPDHSGNSSTSPLPESSATVTDSFPKSSSEKSRKRKRQAPSAQDDRISSASAERRREVSSLLVSVLEAVRCMVRACESSDSQTPAFACEYMKSVLRTGPEAAARIVGRFLSSGSLVLEDLDHYYMAFQDSISWVGVLLDIWNNRAVSVDDTLGGLSNAAFSSECLSSVALLLPRYRSLIPQDSAIKATIRILEQLVARHIFIPARSAFFAPSHSKTQSVSTSKIYEPRLLLDLLKPFREEIMNAQAQINKTSHSEHPVGELTNGIPSLFDTAIRCSTRSSPRKRLTERPWLLALFRGLAEADGISLSYAPGQELQQSKATVLDQLLHVCVKREVPLETDTLRTIMHQLSGLLGEESDLTNWNLIAKVLKLDANVFLLSKNTNGNTDGQGSGEPNMLRLLLSKITAKITREYSGIPQDYLIVKAQIIQPLMLEFSRARNMSGFIEHWRRELTDFNEQYAARKRERGHALSVWQDEDLGLWLREYLESSMTGNQLLQAFTSAHHQLQSSQKTASELSGTFASSVVIDAILGAVDQAQTFDILREEIPQVYSTVSGLLLSMDSSLNTQHGAVYRWHLWRMLARIYEHSTWAQSLQSDKANTFDASECSTEGLVKEAKVTVQRAMKDEVRENVTPHSADTIEALHLLLALNIDPAESSVLVPLPRDAMSEALAAATHMLFHKVPCPWDPSPNWGKRTSFSWDGNPETLPALLDGDLLVPTILLLYRFRRLLSAISSDIRRRLLRSLHWIAYWETWLKLRDECNNSMDREGQMTSAWQAILVDEYILEDASLKDNLLSTLHGGLCAHRNEAGEGTDRGEHDLSGRKTARYFVEDNREDFRDFSIKCYLDLPLKVIHRQHREDVLDRLYQHITDPDIRLTLPQLSNIIALMARLMELPNASSKLATDSDTLWRMAELECFHDSDSYREEVICRSFETLVERTLAHLINTKEQDRSQQYLMAFQKRTQELIEVAVKNNTLLQFIASDIVRASIPLFGRHRDTLASTGIGFDIDESQRQYHQSLVDVLKDIKAPNNENDLLVLEQALRALTVLPNQWGSMEGEISSATERIASLLIEKWTYGIWKLDSEESKSPPIRPSLLVLAYKAIAGIPRLGERSIRQTLALRLLDLGIKSHPSSVGLTSAQRQSVLSSFRHSMQSSDWEEKVGQLCELEAFDLKANTSRLLLLGVLVSTIDGDENAKMDVGRSLANIFTRLCDALPLADTSPHFNLITDIMELIMRNKAWAITQYSIDNALKSIVVCCSPTGPKFDMPSPSSVFLRLTKLLSTILAIHRPKLGGRFHLVIPVMQGLLRCLFVSLSKGITKSSKAVNRPPWLESKVPALGAIDAAAYSRLLTTLCDPTVSSVTSSRNRSKNDLKDETKKAKAIAGQYMPYVLMEYTQCQLRSRMPPEVKAALMPGLHAVFDVMAQDTMRTLNAAMDSSNRAIFKDLYNDYRRFGKWNEK